MFTDEISYLLYESSLKPTIHDANSLLSMCLAEILVITLY